MKKPDIFRLIDIEPDEVSIVTDGANQKRFIIRKEESMPRVTKNADGTFTKVEEPAAAPEPKTFTISESVLQVMEDHKELLEKLSVDELIKRINKEEPTMEKDDKQEEVKSDMEVLKDLNSSLVQSVSALTEEVASLKSQVEKLDAKEEVAEPEVTAPEVDDVKVEAPSDEVKETIAKLSNEITELRASLTKALDTVPAPASGDSDVTPKAEFVWPDDLNS